MKITDALNAAPVFTHEELETSAAMAKGPEKPAEKVFVGQLRRHPDPAMQSGKCILIPEGSPFGLEFGVDDIVEVEPLPGAAHHVKARVRGGIHCIVHLQKDVKPHYHVLQHGDLTDVLVHTRMRAECCACCGWNMHQALV